MPYSEGFGFITNLEDEEGNNVIDAVIAHEIGHQWWAHQEVAANMQGGTMLTESFSEYSSLMVMKNDLKDDMRMVDFLKYDYQRYLGGRSRESQKEVPLYKVENQGYIHYGKGSIVLYSLQDYIGEDKVNLALRNFLNDYKYKDPPYPRSLDFLAHLDSVVPDSMKYLIDDYFKKITLHDYRLKEATMTEENGQYAVKVNFEARKYYADTLGNESPAELHEWVDVGVFADDERKDLITYKRIYVDKEQMEYTIYTDRKPVKAAIDPRRVVIERVIDDNIKTIDES
jgi:aminopeptidase N